MSEYIVSDEVLKDIQKKAWHAGHAGIEPYPLQCADGEEIVRCMDCKNSFTDEEEPGMVCRRKVVNAWGDKVEIEFMVDPNGFCAWGKKKDK